jgi:hypothetical protein
VCISPGSIRARSCSDTEIAAEVASLIQPAPGPAVRAASLAIRMATPWCVAFLSLPTRISLAGAVDGGGTEGAVGKLAVIPGSLAVMDALIDLAGRRRGAFYHREAGPERVPL